MSSHLKSNNLPAASISVTAVKIRVVSIVQRIIREHRDTAAILVASLALAGCASGSALVTGEVRPAIEDHTTVLILTEVPDDSEVIAVVKASSDSGWSQQGSLNYAVAELKKQAAKVGANAVVLGDRETSSQTVGVPDDDGGTWISSFETEIVQGVAIWIDQAT